MRGTGNKAQHADESHRGRPPVLEIQHISQKRHGAGYVGNIARKCKESPRINRTGKKGHDVAQPSETGIGNIVFVQIRAIRLPKRRRVLPVVAQSVGVGRFVSVH